VCGSMGLWSEGGRKGGFKCVRGSWIAVFAVVKVGVTFCWQSVIRRMWCTLTA
jgi:hypothetical protein